MTEAVQATTAFRPSEDAERLELWGWARLLAPQPASASTTNDANVNCLRTTRWYGARSCIRSPFSDLLCDCDRLRSPMVEVPIAPGRTGSSNLNLQSR